MVHVVLAPGASTELVPTLDGEPGLRRLKPLKVGLVLNRPSATPVPHTGAPWPLLDSSLLLPVVMTVVVVPVD